MHEVFSVVCVVYKLTMGVAVIGVISGVFIQETFEAAQSDDQTLLRKRKQKAHLQNLKLQRLVDIMVPAGGSIDMKAFKRVLRNEEVQHWLKAMDYESSDAELLFYLMDQNQDGRLTAKELIEGMASMRGCARNMDVKLLLRQSPVGRLINSPVTKCISTTSALQMMDEEEVLNGRSSEMWPVRSSSSSSPRRSRSASTRAERLVLTCA